jgi:hypothetical protein
MANPNIVNVTDIRGKTYVNEMSNGAPATNVSNTAGSNSIYKINTISVSNATGSAASATVSIYRDPGSGARYFDIANTVSVPNNSTLIVTSKDTSFYLEEGDILTSFASAAGLEIMVSYEIIS